MRADGRPSRVAVAKVMALASYGSDRPASSYQDAKCAKGSMIEGSGMPYPVEAGRRRLRVGTGDPTWAGDHPPRLAPMLSKPRPKIDRQGPPAAFDD